MIRKLIEDYKYFTDAYHLTQPDKHVNPKGSTSQNGLMFTPERGKAVYNLWKNIIAGRNLAWVELQKMTAACYNCGVPGHPGLYAKAPDKREELMTWDDLLGLGTMYTLSDNKKFALEIVEWGRKHLWFFNNVEPGKFHKKAWLGRYPMVIAHLEWAAGKTPHNLGMAIFAIAGLYLLSVPTPGLTYAFFAVYYFKRAYWCAAILQSALTGSDEESQTGEDTWRLAWHMVVVAELRAGWVERQVTKFWRKRFLRQWPSGFGGLSESYFAHPHPHGKWLKGDSGN